MSQTVYVCISKIMRLPIKAGICTYNLVEVLTENFCLFLKSCFLWFFLNCFGENSIITGSRLKIEPNFKTLSLKFLSLVIIKILVLVSSSILTPNTRSLTLIFLHLKPKVIDLTKTWLIKISLQ